MACVDPRRDGGRVSSEVVQNHWKQGTDGFGPELDVDARRGCKVEAGEMKLFSEQN